MILDLSNCKKGNEAVSFVTVLYNALFYASTKAHPFLTFVETTEMDNTPTKLSIIKGIETCRELFIGHIINYFSSFPKPIKVSSTYRVSPLTKNIRILIIPYPRYSLMERHISNKTVMDISINDTHLKFHEKDISVINKKMDISKRILNIFENEVNFNKSTITRCSWGENKDLQKIVYNTLFVNGGGSITDNTTLNTALAISSLPVYALNMDKRFLSTPQALSLYTLLARTIFTTNDYDELFSEISDIKSLKDAFIEYSRSDVNKSGPDRKYFVDYELFFEYCKNMKNLYDTFDPRINFEKGSYSFQGITNLCNTMVQDNQKLNNRFKLIKDRMNKKSLTK